MTRKDYELIAAALKGFIVADSRHVAHMAETGFEPSAAERARLTRTIALVREMTDALANDNPRFNREIFLKACGL
jgi:hypothetical protein